MKFPQAYIENDLRAEKIGAGLHKHPLISSKQMDYLRKAINISISVQCLVCSSGGMSRAWRPPPSPTSRRRIRCSRKPAGQQIM